MKIYIDYIMFINFMFDFLLLLSVSIILRRNVKLKKIIFGSLIGSISILILFIKINNIELFLIKFFISILMILTTFNYKNMKYTIKNLSYLYMSSMILGGSLYFLNVQFSYKQEGLIFYHTGIGINMIIILILSPIIIYTYIRQAKNLKNKYANCYKLNIKYNKQEINVTGFMDTGNKLIDPVTHYPVIIVNEKLIKVSNYLLVPYNTISEKNYLKCIKPEEVIIDGKIKKHVLIGVTNNINIEGIDCILNPALMEEI